MYYLPVELLIIIFNILGKGYYFPITMVCRRWRDIIDILKKNNKMKTPVRIISHSIPLIKWGRANGCPWDEYTCSFAAYDDHLDVLQWLRAQVPPCPWNEHTCYSAANNGHLEVLKWLRSQDPPCPMNDLTIHTALDNKHKHIIEWFELSHHKWYTH